MDEPAAVSANEVDLIQRETIGHLDGYDRSIALDGFGKDRDVSRKHANVIGHGGSIEGQGGGRSDVLSHGLAKCRVGGEQSIDGLDQIQNKRLLFRQEERLDPAELAADAMLVYALDGLGGREGVLREINCVLRGA